MTASSVPELLWTPSAELRESSEMAALARDVGAADYDALWRWSVADVGRFWRTVWDRFGVRADGDPTTVLADAAMPGACWFPDVRLSFAEHALDGHDPAALAIQHASELHPLAAWTWGDLTAEVGRVRAGLQALGVGRGDRVVGYLPNVPETVAAFLATASLGAVWSCCSPDFGVRAVVDRFAQIEPKVLLACDGYSYGGRDFHRSAVVAELEASLPTLVRTVRLPILAAGDDWERAFPATDAPLTFERVPFDHPLWIVYSSGTTGVPKAIVHGHGGPLLEYLKTWRLHNDLRPGDHVMWTTTTGWVMWNCLVGALLSGAAVVLYDGSLSHPDMGVLWDLLDAAAVDQFGTGAAYIHACMKAGIEPRVGRDLSRLRVVGSTGSPLAPEGFKWVYDQLGADVMLSSVSGGTEIASGFVGGAPLMPVHAGEIPARLLGVAVEAWDQDGRPLEDEVGELVVTQPMPSMPVRLWDDPDGARERDVWFSMFPGAWRHGDWIRITSRGSAVLLGRSDATINRAGLRVGSAEIYASVLPVEDVADALVVEVPSTATAGESWIGLFVTLADGRVLTDELIAELRERIATECSRRHVPDEVIAAPEVPRTLTGKVLEVPVKRLLMGGAPTMVASRGALANPAAFDWFVAFAEHWRAGRSGIGV